MLCAPYIASIKSKFGPWMIVTRKGNYRGNKGSIDAKEPNHDSFGKWSGGSRFGVLREESELENDSVEISNMAVTIDKHMKTFAPSKKKDKIISHGCNDSTKLEDFRLSV